MASDSRTHSGFFGRYRPNSRVLHTPVLSVEPPRTHAGEPSPAPASSLLVCSATNHHRSPAEPLTHGPPARGGFTTASLSVGRAPLRATPDRVSRGRSRVEPPHHTTGRRLRTATSTFPTTASSDKLTHERCNTTQTIAACRSVIGRRQGSIRNRLDSCGIRERRARERPLSPADELPAGIVCPKCGRLVIRTSVSSSRVRAAGRRDYSHDTDPTRAPRCGGRLWASDHRPVSSQRADTLICANTLYVEIHIRYTTNLPSV